MEPMKLTVLIDEDSNECLYVEGKAWAGRGEMTVYVCDLVAEAGEWPILLRHIKVTGSRYGQWPENLEDARIWMGDKATVS